MSQIKISSTDWLAISLRNGGIGMFNLHDTCSWQYLQTESSIDQSENENTRQNISKFSPDGQRFVCNGQNKQLNVYIRSDFEQTKTWWELQRMFTVKNSISSIDLTNESLYIGDINGDVYKVDLSSDDKYPDLITSPVKNKSMLLDIVFLQMNEKKSFLITADQDAQIHLINHYPNTDGYCLGHTEFVSHVKLIDNNHILSASGDGTLRLWRLPDCVPLMSLHSKAFVLLSEEVFYTELSDSENSHQTDEIHLPKSSIINYSIWKIDVTHFNSDTFLAFSIYAHRFHSIYLTTLSNMKQLTNEQRKLTLDIAYGTIVDYCLVNHDSNLDLYILFNSNVLLKINVMSILLCDRTEYFSQSNETIQEINNILTRKEFYLMDCNNNYLAFDDIIFKRLFKSKMISSCKREAEQTEDNQRKKQTLSNNEGNHLTFE